MINRILFIVVITISFLSCSDDKASKVEYTVVSDSYLRAIKQNGKILYAPVFTAAANKKIEHGTATDSKGKTVNLARFWNHSQYIRKVPSMGDYSADYPESETYNIKILAVSSDDKDKTFSETLYKENVPSAFDIVSLNTDTNQEKIELKWNKSKCDFYTITISEEIAKFPVFQTPQLGAPNTKKDTIEYTITHDALKWFSHLQSGKKYILQVRSFNAKNETDITGEFLATKEFTW